MYKLQDKVRHWNILVIEPNDLIEDIMPHIRGTRFIEIFIPKDFDRSVIELLMPCITIVGQMVGNIRYYE